ncbi:hypothetical protein [[Pseudomonas] boreopolis]|uniref:hypothetical protein n=1 Tax=Xanthomonas boreopolis TaxID=86183 RepID=UPI003D9BBCA0
MASLTISTVIPAKAGSAFQQPKRFTTAEWLVMADHPGTLALGHLAIKAKAFAFGELPFFACAKKGNPKKAHPAFAPAALLRVRGAGGIFGRGILPRPKTTHIHVRRPFGVFPTVSAATEGPGRSKAKSNSKITSNSNFTDR